MQKIAVIIFALFCCCQLPSTLANNLTQDGGDGDDVPTGFPTFHFSLTSSENVTNVLYDSCNITACNPVHYKHCYEDKAVQLVIHSIAVILGIVSAFFGKDGIYYYIH